MIGQVAALRTRRTTSPSCTATIDEGARDAPGCRRRRNIPPQEAGHDRDVAIVGMAAIFPGAPDLDAFWANIVAGKNASARCPPSAGTSRRTTTRRRCRASRTPSKWGGFLDAVPFDPLAYGIPPQSLAAIEPVQLLALEVARRALADAGYVDRAFDRERTVGDLRRRGRHRPAGAYGFRALFPQYVGDLPDAARRGAADAHRGLVPRRAVERDRRPHRQPARSRRRQLHRRRRVRLVARRGRRRVQGARGRAPATWCCAAAPTCTTASTTTCCSRACTRCRRPASARPSTRPPTASCSARASRASCSSGSPTPSATAIASTP